MTSFGRVASLRPVAFRAAFALVAALMVANCSRVPVEERRYAIITPRNTACPLLLGGNVGCRESPTVPTRITRIADYHDPQPDYLSGVSCDGDVCAVYEENRLFLAFPMGLSAIDRGVHHISVRRLNGHSAIILSTRDQGDACYLPRDLQSASDRKRLCANLPGKSR